MPERPCELGSCHQGAHSKRVVPERNRSPVENQGAREGSGDSACRLDKADMRFMWVENERRDGCKCAGRSRIPRLEISSTYFRV